MKQLFFNQFNSSPTRAIRVAHIMKLSTLLALPAALVQLVFAAGEPSSYQEQLHLKPLPGGSLYAGFSFTSTTPYSEYAGNHFRFFPRSLAQILQYTHTAELHLRFALGRWDEESWGSRPRSGLREGGNGVELWAWLEGDEYGDVGGRWSDLVNSLSGLFCASLNFIDSGKTVRPLLSFESEGALDELQAARRNVTGVKQGDLQLLHGMLPHEVVCTENLTPFLKLLPCKGKAGISSLLDGHKVFDANWQTMSIDVRPICSADGCDLEVEQTVDMVLDVQRSMRPRESPIPRPPPVEELECDESRHYHSDDTCYPKTPEGEMEWSLSRIFGRSIRGSCPIGKNAGPFFDVIADVGPGRKVDVICDANVRRGMIDYSLAFQIPEGKDFDLNLPQQVLEESQGSNLQQPPLYASRQMTGYGAERGGMHALLRNPHPYPQRVVYLESLPWFLRPYMHTLHMDGGKIEKMYYTPLLDRERGTHLELLLSIPAHSIVELSYDFEKAILRYTEYPPDANRGFDIGAAIIRVLPSNSSDDGQAVNKQEDYYIRTTALLLPLPTPDFSMPYNVIILTSTVLALGFGSVFNLLVRRFVLVEEVPVGPLQVLVARIKALVGRLRNREDRRMVEVATGDDTVKKDANGPGGVNGTPGRGKVDRKKDR